MQYEVVLPAAGSGKRMGAGQNKLFLQNAKNMNIDVKNVAFY